MAQAEHLQEKKVVVVGAGFAGVSAARTLLAQSEVPIDVTILEASSRVGGRASTREVYICLAGSDCVVEVYGAVSN